MIARKFRRPEPKLIKTHQHLGYQWFAACYAPMKSRRISVHSAALEAFVGPRPDGQEARHLDGNRSNNAISNLAWGTHVENMKDKHRHGTHREAERLPQTKLTSKQVRIIRWSAVVSDRLRQPRIPRNSGLTDAFGVHLVHLYALMRGKLWNSAAFAGEIPADVLACVKGM